MFEEIKHIDSSIEKLISFGRIVGLVFALIGAFQLFTGRSLGPYFLGIGIALIILGFLAPAVLKPIYIGWMSFALVMSWIMTRIILTILFYFILTPIALLAKATGKKFMTLAPDTTQNSYWNQRKRASATPDNYTRQF